MVFGFQQLLSLFSSGLHIKQYIWCMISIPYGKLFYLQAACQTKQQKQKSSSALGRNKILKKKGHLFFFKKKEVHFRHLWGLVYHREWAVGLWSSEEGQQHWKEEVTRGRCATYLCTNIHRPWIRTCAFIKSHKHGITWQGILASLVVRLLLKWRTAAKKDERAQKWHKGDNFIG